MRQYREQWNAIEQWENERPSSFSPIWAGPAGEHSVFPEIWFTADWHGKHLCCVSRYVFLLHVIVVAHGLYHFSCLLLIIYTPGPKFAMRNVGGRFSDSDVRMLYIDCALC
jgi:hypothetical protein